MIRNEIIPYDPRLKSITRVLRKNMTSAEISLWDKLRKKQLGYKFHRQTPLIHYVVDFYCHELKLAIEIDGGLHNHPQVSVNDLECRQEIESFGVHFLRFENKEGRVQVKKDINDILQTIEDWIKLSEKNDKNARRTKRGI